MIILCNGCSSSGKSSAISAMKSLSDECIIHLGIDDYFRMLLPKYANGGVCQKDGFAWITKEINGKQIVQVAAGVRGLQMVRGMISMVKTLHEHGICVVIEEVLEEDIVLMEYCTAFVNYPIYFIGMWCQLNVLEHREILRGDRISGLARAQFNVVNRYQEYYDLTIDNTLKDPFEAAQMILDYINNNTTPVNFTKLSQKLLS